MQVLNQDETPLLYSLVFGEGVVNDATSVVLFNAVQNFDLSHINTTIALQLVGTFLYLFISSTVLGVVVSLSVLSREMNILRHLPFSIDRLTLIFCFRLGCLVHMS